MVAIEGGGRFRDRVDDDRSDRDVLAGEHGSVESVHQQRRADPEPMMTAIYRKTSEQGDRNREVLRKAAAHRCGGVLVVELAGDEGVVADNGAAVGRRDERSRGVAALVLAGGPLQPDVKRGFTAVEAIDSVGSRVE